MIINSQWRLMEQGAVRHATPHTAGDTHFSTTLHDGTKHFRAKIGIIMISVTKRMVHYAGG